MIEVKVTAPTAPELSALVKSLAAQFGVNLPTAQAELVAEVEGNQVATEVAKEEVKTEVVKEKKAKKEKVEAPKEEKTSAPVEEKTTPSVEETQATSLTKQDIADACQKVSAAKNLDAAKTILAKFKNEKGEPCRRISDVLEADYASFVSKCDEAIK